MIYIVYLIFYLIMNMNLTTIKKNNYNAISNYENIKVFIFSFDNYRSRFLSRTSDDLSLDNESHNTVRNQNDIYNCFLNIVK